MPIARLVLAAAALLLAFGLASIDHGGCEHPSRLVSNPGLEYCRSKRPQESTTGLATAVDGVLLQHIEASTPVIRLN